jgi:hypothetical protein
LQPTDQSVVEGSPATFAVTASNAKSFQWQVGIAGNWSDIAGANAASYITAPTTLTMSGQQFRVIVASESNKVTSSTATLHVTVSLVAPSFSRHPAPVSTSAGQTASFDVAALGTPTPGLQWQRSSDGGASWSDVAGATASSYTTPTLTMSDDGTLLRVMASNSVGSASSSSARLSVLPAIPPALLSQPQSLSLQMPASASFSVTVSGSPTPVLQWQISADGQNWRDISGATAASYALAEVSTLDNGYWFRIHASNIAGSTTSRAAQLSVSARTLLSRFIGETAGAGHRDGALLSALYELPVAIARDSVGNLYVSDAGNHTVRRLDIGTGLVSTIAGQAYSAGDEDGPVASARLRAPGAIAVDGDGNVFVADGGQGYTAGGRYRIRKISTAGMVSTLASRPPPVFDEYLRGYYIGGIATDRQGNLYFTDTDVVRKLDRTGAMSVLAGLEYTWGDADGVGSAARFRSLDQIKFDDSSDSLYVHDFEKLRRVTLNGEVSFFSYCGFEYTEVPCNGFFRPSNSVGDRFDVTRLASFVYKAKNGGMSKVYGDHLLGGELVSGRPVYPTWRDGPTATAIVGPSVSGLARDPTGNTYLSTGGAVRIVSPEGMLSTYAGDVAAGGDALVTEYGIYRSRTTTPIDGRAYQARFEYPSRLLAVGNKVYVCDIDRLRVIDAERNVTTLASWPLFQSYLDEAVVFNGYCTGLSVDSQGTVHVLTNRGDIYKVSASGVLTTLDQRSSTPVFRATGIAIDSAGNYFVTDARKNVVYLITPSGNRTVWAGQYDSPRGYADGSKTAAQFSSPADIVIDGADNLYVGDSGNNVVRRITPAGMVSTVLGQAGFASVVYGTQPRLRGADNLAIWGQDELMISGTHQVMRAIVPGVACKCRPRPLRSNRVKAR